jgi:septal ring factor EnvC (AmiA/AmiB activator)
MNRRNRWLKCVAAVCLAGRAVAAQTPAAQTPAPQPAPAGQASERSRDTAALRAAERIRTLQREAESLVSQSRSLLAELRKLEITRQLEVEEAAQIDREMTATQQALTAAADRARQLQSTADVERPEVQSRLVQLYKMGPAGYWRLLLEPQDVRSIGRAYRTASALTRLDRDHVRQHAATLEALARERKQLEEKVASLASLQEKAVKARAAVDRAIAARSALVASLDERRDLNAQLTGELEDAQQNLNRTVGQLGRPATVSLPLRPFRGALPWPAEGIVTQRFGRARPGRAQPATPNGIEVSLPEGQTVRSVHEGTVAFADRFTGYGNLVIIDHGDGSHSLYGHLRTLEVERGAQVDAQDVLGESGRNPAGNPSLYFELRVDGKPVDPLQWLRKSL